MWFNPGGNEMSDEEWSSPFVRCLGMLLSGDTIDVLSFEGEPIRDQTFLLLINAHYETIPFVLPGEEHLTWRIVLDSVEDEGFVRDDQTHASGDDFEVEGRAIKLLRLTAGSQARARHESWKKRQVQLPRDERREAMASRRGAKKSKEAAAEKEPGGDPDSGAETGS
jgi:glycogen operon protein